MRVVLPGNFPGSALTFAGRGAQLVGHLLRSGVDVGAALFYLFPGPLLGAAAAFWEARPAPGALHPEP